MLDESTERYDGIEDIFRFRITRNTSVLIEQDGYTYQYIMMTSPGVVPTCLAFSFTLCNKPATTIFSSTVVVSKPYIERGHIYTGEIN